MEHVFIARQPIFDRTRTVRGYELLYRTGFVPRAPVDDGESATARVVLSALTKSGSIGSSASGARGSTSRLDSCCTDLRRVCRRTA